jgi:hypothetical protein
MTMMTNPQSIRGQPERCRLHAATAMAGILLLALAAGCRQKASTADEDRADAVRVEELASSPLQITLTIDPGSVSVDHDVLAILRIQAPSQTDVTLPPLEDRFQGFAVSGAYDAEPSQKDGRTTLERRIRLTPLVADEYRLAPLVVQYVNRGRNPPVSAWLTTRSVLFPVRKLPAAGGDNLDLDVKPQRVPPSGLTIALWCCTGLAVIGIGLLLWKIFTRVREEVRLARMNPKERALHELDRLLAKDLLARNLVKDFYVELTMIVRRYIERAHGIRAPEQTTEEFLMAMAADAHFPPAVASRLKSFLQAADLVKFAAYLPPRESTGAAVDTAREYVVSDASTQSTDTPDKASAEGGSRVSAR